MSADPTWVAEMTRRRKLALSYFHPRLHSPEAAALRRSRDVVWDRRLGVYLFPDRETLDRCRAACEALDAAAAREEDARREAMGFELTPPVPAPPAPQVYTLRQRRAAPVGAVLQASLARIAEGYPPQLRVVRIVTVPLPHSPILGTRDLQQVYVITCIAEPTLDSDADSAAR
jgi:hypothetical protein